MQRENEHTRVVMGEYQSHWIQGSSQFKILWDRENTKVCVAGGEIKFLKVKFLKLMPWLVNGVKQNSWVMRIVRAQTKGQ